MQIGRNAAKKETASMARHDGTCSAGCSAVPVLGKEEMQRSVQKLSLSVSEAAEQLLLGPVEGQGFADQTFEGQIGGLRSLDDGLLDLW